MYGTLFDQRYRQEAIDRAGRLSPASARRWGTLTVGKAVVHMAGQLRMALGEVPGGPVQGPFRFTLTRYLVIHVLSWPKGKAKAPAASLAAEPGELAADVARLQELIGRFAARDPAGPWAAHPMFGAMTGRDWGVLCYRHLDHHLTQFGA